MWSKYRDLPSFESSQHMEQFPSRMPCLDKTINEYHLWHGTSWSTVEIIKKYGLDPRVSSVMGMFGGGCYFAEDSSKSNQYIPCPTCGKGAIFRAKSEIFCGYPLPERAQGGGLIHDSPRSIRHWPQDKVTASEFIGDPILLFNNHAAFPTTPS